MLMKEKGYDEFLASKIAAGRADIDAGRICTLDEANAEWLKIVDKFAREEAEFSEVIFHV